MSAPDARGPFGTRATLDAGDGPVAIYRLDRLEREGLVAGLERLPVSIRVLLEAVVRGCDGFAVTERDVRDLAAWRADAVPAIEVPFKPARVVLQDFTGVPVVVDLAAMRDAARALGGDPGRINPRVPVDLVVDHSVQVDHFGSPEALVRNVALEYARNNERYALLRWAQSSLRNFRVVPPATGIVHQVNLEYLASVVVRADGDGGPLAYPDTLVGTDSHTTMINGLGVLGWGVGGIEAEAVMLGQPLFMQAPPVVGVRLTGRLRPGVTATDLVLTVTELLRKHGVVEKFVEFCGEGLDGLTLEDRATISNMAPEYGATCALFPVDAETIAYLVRTGRPAAHARLVERYAREQGLFRTAATPEPEFSELVALDLATVEPSVAGPKRPQDRVPLAGAKAAFRAALSAPVGARGFGLPEAALATRVAVAADHGEATLGHGSVVIAAITSCTNTSNPSVLVTAGLIARRARALGLTVAPAVKTSLAPGSQVVTEYLRESGLLADLEALRFSLVGYGCTTCIGNSGPLADAIADAIRANKLVAAAVLSGNRNFEGRIHPLVRAAYLASPPLVVAYALAGTVDIDLATEPLGVGRDGKPVFLRDLWPAPEEVVATVRRSVTPAMFERIYRDVFRGDAAWSAIDVAGADGERYPWDATSTYIRHPPYFEGLAAEPAPVSDVSGARVLAVLGDSVTTDHISPAGDIAQDGPAGEFLGAAGLRKVDFNSYGSRRGNHLVMMRGTFANIRLKNQMVPGVEGGVTVHVPSGERMSIFAAAERYRAEGVPLVILAGKEYGSGSSRDWAAKGPALLGVRVVIAESYERIHRSNLVGMGILPLTYPDGQTAASLGLDGRETIDVSGLAAGLAPRMTVQVRATRPDGAVVAFDARARLDGPVDVHYYRHGGILPAVLREIVKA